MRYKRGLFKFNSRGARAALVAMHQLTTLEGRQVMLDTYNGQLIDLEHEKWDAEHVFTLLSAWQAGFEGQYLTNREAALKSMKRFANDPRNLWVSGASSNRSRGAKTIWNWSPLCLTSVPKRNAVVRQLAGDFGLTLTKPQQWAMDWSDNKILVKYKHGIHLGKARAWLIQNGFYKFLMPF